jgi:hypothetical protein
VPLLLNKSLSGKFTESTNYKVNDSVVKIKQEESEDSKRSLEKRSKTKKLSVQLNESIAKSVVSVQSIESPEKRKPSEEKMKSPKVYKPPESLELREAKKF